MDKLTAGDVRAGALTAEKANKDCVMLTRYAPILVDGTLSGANREDTSRFEQLNEKQESEGSISGADSSDQDAKKLDSNIFNVRDPLTSDDALARLPEHEREVLNRQLDVRSVSVSWLKLYRFATRNDIIIAYIAAFCAIGGGAVLPLMTVIFGSLSGNLTGFALGTVEASSFSGLLDSKVLYFVYLAIGEFILI